MTPEQIRKRFEELRQWGLSKGAPQHYRERQARQILLKELMAQGVSNAEAVYNIFKAKEENNAQNG